MTLLSGEKLGLLCCRLAFRLGKRWQHCVPMRWGHATLMSSIFSLCCQIKVTTSSPARRRCVYLILLHAQLNVNLFATLQNTKPTTMATSSLSFPEEPPISFSAWWDVIDELCGPWLTYRLTGLPTDRRCLRNSLGNLIKTHRGNRIMAEIYALERNFLMILIIIYSNYIRPCNERQLKVWALQSCWNWNGLIWGFTF